MQNLFLRSLSALLTIFVFQAIVALPVSAKSKELRTDGPPGSEYADFSRTEGQLQLGAQFGALLPSNGKDSSFLLGADADFRPYDLFGIRLTYHQGVQSPRSSVFALTPLVHSTYSNFEPYAFFGPGVAITNNRGDTNLKFAVTMGVGADVLLIDHLGIGMSYMYSSLIDWPDFHQLTARMSYRF